MSNLIEPILTSKYGLFGSTKIRFYSLLSPIQGSSYKESDFLHYLFRPVVDVVLLPLFLFDAAVCLINSLVSFLAAIHLWVSSPSAKAFHDKTAVRGNAREQLEQAKENFCNTVSAIVAAFINPILSILSLLSRVLASIGRAVVDLCKDSGNYRL